MSVENTQKPVSGDAVARPDKELNVEEKHAGQDLDTGDMIDTSDYTPEQYKRIRWKADLYLMPLLFFIDGIQIVDKNAISIQAVFGMREDTGLHGQQYQWLTTIFYLAYLIGEFPSVYLLQRWRVGWTLSFYMLGWGVSVICISAAQNFAALIVLRALQGFFECAVKPGFLQITGAWYKTGEHSSRSLLWQSSEGVIAVICNLILYGIARHAENHTGLAAWRCVSLFLGSLTIVGSIWSFFVLGTVHEVRWLSPEEKRIATARVIENGAGQDTTGKRWDWDQVIEALCDPQFYFSFLNTFVTCIPNGGITSFAYLMYQSFGFDSYQSMLYGLPRISVYTVVFIIVAWWTQKVQNQRLWITLPCCVLPFVGMLVMSLLPNGPEYKWIKWGMFMCTIVFSLATFLAWSLLPSNFLGKTKYSFSSGMTLIAYCTGNMVGSQVFRTKDAPRYVLGTIICSACFGLQFFILLGWRLYYTWENKRRDRLMVEMGVSEEDRVRLARELGEQGKTDRQNIYIRYAM
ncbi:uncharacterized protein A1O9_02074 [Exophiala aquamarina CBS 119918]|uniref:Major facilitator superfamily (MFS) profile domain-containing protein n=1 Tax=Exophiala aquamarina CBS 119918 TaxID=1182545 RepID=A0A072PME7_9EURO|nr:uncharacterized protein A1O9_02074 [Exophiala aquamarina CBS 119918]KEF60513.1 hypothetical protein A1O9_02074 [Exophiala aquamarina CBS 119918]